MKRQYPVALLLFSLLAGGCGGLSDVGDQENDDTPPVADVVVLNQPFSKDASGNVTTTVRAGSEVFLSGKDSDGEVAPVLRFEWSLQTSGASADGVKLVTRNKSTVSFTAPMVSQDTPLSFRLKVIDANGNTDQKDVAVTVRGVPDANHFLSYKLDDSRRIRLAAIASRKVTPAELQAIGDVSFEMTVRRLVDYTTPEVDGPYLEVASDVVSGKWLAGYGAGSNCDDPANPAFQIPVPAVDIDDILSVIDVSRAELEPNPAAVDDFELKLQVSIRVTSGSLPAGVAAYVCADRVEAAPPLAVGAQKAHDGRIQFAQTDPASGLLELDLQELLGRPATPDDAFDTRESARAYYDAIDPDDERTNLLDWLQVNGFIAADATGFDWDALQAGSQAHAIYTNNFDLGFGRDMYARVVSCDDGASPALGQTIDAARSGHCDIAAVVVNYASLEAATKKLNPVLAVAMEYSAPPCGAQGCSVPPGDGTRRIVQFYTFAPDNLTGEFRRVLSANLDGRGEKYMPQVCTVCHGGTPGGLTAEGDYRDGGDVNATFLPWDLDSFMYADADGAGADPSYSDASQRELYTRAAQADSLRDLNQLAWLTYSDGTRPNRFVLPRQLIEGWYGTDFSKAFDSQYVPAGWTADGVDGSPETADDNPADAADIYHDVFARNCRACHVAQAPDARAGGLRLESFAGASGPFNTCDGQLTTDGGGNIIEPRSIGTLHQVPMACYRQFYNAPSLPQRLAAGAMPFARLTMDRFWAGAGTTPAADLLFDHLTREYTAANDSSKLAALARPGTAQAQVVISAPVTATGDIGTDVVLDGSGSRFATDFAWSLERCDSPGSVVAQCRSASLPGAVAAGIDADLTCTAASESIVGASSPLASFRTQATGIYRPTLAISAGASTGDTLLAVPDWRPCPRSSGIADLGSTNVGTDVALSADTFFSRGNGDLASHTLSISAPAGSLIAIAPSACTTQAGCPGNTPVTLTPTGVAINDVTFTLRDQDGDESVEVVSRLSGSSELSAINFVQSTDANKKIPVDILGANGNPENVTFEILQQENCPNGGDAREACLRNSLDQPATLTVTASGFDYTPPPNFSTHDHTDGVLQEDLANGRFLEQIRYRLKRTDNPDDFSAPATVSIPVKALTTFDTARGVFSNAPCSGCHKAAGDGGIAPDYGASDYDTFRNGNDGKLLNMLESRVHLDNPQNSGLVCYPKRACILDPPVSQHPLFLATDGQVKPILDWIASGANDF